MASTTRLEESTSDERDSLKWLSDLSARTTERILAPRSIVTVRRVRSRVDVATARELSAYYTYLRAQQANDGDVDWASRTNVPSKADELLGPPREVRTQTVDLELRVACE